MFANTYKLDSRPKWEMEALTLHEAVPGHHLQIALAQELQGLPEFRKNSSYTAFVEGWALYCGEPRRRDGLLRGSVREVRPAHLRDVARRPAGRRHRPALDGLDARSRRSTSSAPTPPRPTQDIIVEVDRYIVWPGQALGYKMGELKIKELRANAERQLGAKFDVRAFHDVVLLQGALPMDVLEKRVNEWIASRASR